MQQLRAPPRACRRPSGVCVGECPAACPRPLAQTKATLKESGMTAHRHAPAMAIGRDGMRHVLRASTGHVHAARAPPASCARRLVLCCAAVMAAMRRIRTEQGRCARTPRAWDFPAPQRGLAMRGSFCFHLKLADCPGFCGWSTCCPQMPARTGPSSSCASQQSTCSAHGGVNGGFAGVVTP